jgi:hypothetical protein
MKYLFLICCLGLSLVAAKAQNSDIGQERFAFFNESTNTPVSSILVGESALIKYSIKNLATAGDDIPANTVKVILSFPTTNGNIRPFIYDGSPSFVSGYFTWTYNSDKEALVGENNQAIPAGTGDQDVEIRIRGNEAGIASSTLNIRQGRGISDNIGNNYASARLTVVSAPLPVRMGEFTATPNKCDVILNWKTLSEYNFSRFDIEYCTDGMSFIRVGSVLSKGLPGGSSYTFNFSQVSGIGYYRLKIVDNDGRYYYSSVQKATTTCDTHGLISVFPNPVRTFQKLTVNIVGYDGKATGELYDAAGQRVQSYVLVNGTNELSVSRLPSGVYMLDVLITGTESKKQTFKIVVTR